MAALASPAQAIAAVAAPAATPGGVTGAIHKVPNTILNGESLGRLINSTNVPVSADLRSHGVGTAFHNAG